MSNTNWSRPKVIKFRQIQQGNLGTCYFLAAVPSNLRYRVHRNGKRYEFMYGDGIHVKVHKAKEGGEYNVFTRTVEKSYIKHEKYEGDYTIEKFTVGGLAHEALADITGGVYTYTFASVIPTPPLSNDTILSYFGSSLDGTAHAYRVLGEISPGTYALWNPWGYTEVANYSVFNDTSFNYWSHPLL